mmetsp:Transcript_14682/g.28765  ORF Transcript_14682/g.28765 Transcript_14682/m.28765 type:complete len:307 (-) Transcript_14682:63-983(-)
MSQQDLQKLHNKKIRMLLKSNDALKAEIIQLKKEGHDNYRVKMIKNMKQQVRELQCHVETLKKALLSKGSTIDEIDDMMVAAVNAPKRLRPPSTEQLQKQIAQLKNEKLKLQGQLKASKNSSSSSSSSNSGDMDMLRFGGVLGGDAARGAAIVQANGDMTASERVDVLEAELLAKAKYVDELKDMLDSVQATNRKLNVVKEKFRRSEEKRIRAVEETGRLKEELLSTAADEEAVYQEIRTLRAKVAFLTAAKDKNENRHFAQLADQDKLVQKHKDRETHLLSQIALLKADLKTAQEVVEVYKQRSL